MRVVMAHPRAAPCRTQTPRPRRGGGRGRHGRTASHSRSGLLASGGLAAGTRGGQDGRMEKWIGRTRPVRT
jgi:hypothetical protein